VLDWADNTRIRCDAEPGALADYILALLRHNAPEVEMRKELFVQLEEFLEKGMSHWEFLCRNWGDGIDSKSQNAVRSSTHFSQHSGHSRIFHTAPHRPLPLPRPSLEMTEYPSRWTQWNPPLLLAEHGSGASPTMTGTAAHPRDLGLETTDMLAGGRIGTDKADSTFLLDVHNKATSHQGRKEGSVATITVSNNSFTC